MKRILLTMGGVLTAMNCYAASYTTTQITNDNYDNLYPRLNNQDDVLYASWVNSADIGWTLFKYTASTQTTSQISSANAFYESQQMNNHGDVVWTGNDGTDDEIYLYSATTQTFVPLTDNTLNDTNPQISDNGDVTWLEQHGTTASEAVLWRYDAATGISAPITFAGATRQGYQTMNARGDIIWNAVVNNGNGQQVLLYDAATGTTSNISKNDSAIASNQRIADNGDVAWNSWDLLSGNQSIYYYKAADGSVALLTDNIDGFYFGPQGYTAWTSTDASGNKSISLYNPATSTTNVIVTASTSYGPNITGVSARGDVTWNDIIGTSWNSKVYNAQTNSVVTLSTSTGYGTYELVLGDNGDVLWSLWDGTDFEVHSYQGDNGTITDLSNNSVNDGVALVNANGSILWHRWDPTDNELMLAQRNAGGGGATLPIDVKEVDLDVKGSDAEVTTKFSMDVLPGANDAIAVTLDGVSLVNQPFSAFVAKGNVFKFKSSDTSVTINFTSGTLVVEKSGIDVSAMAALSTAEVSVTIGSATGTDTYTF